MNGGAGLRRLLARPDLRDAAAGLAERRGVALGGLAVAESRAAPSIRTSSAANVSPRGRREERLQRPVLAGGERADLPLALDDEPDGDRLDAAGRQARPDLAPQQRAERVADEAVDDPAGLLGVDEVRVDLARMGERLADRALGDLAEGHPPGLARRDVGRLGDVPGDRLALAVEVGGEVDEVGRLGGLRDLGDLLAAVVRDDVLGGEVVVDVDPELALAGVLGQVADMAVGGEDPVVRAQVALDRPGLGRRSRRSRGSWSSRAESSTGLLRARPPATSPARSPRRGVRTLRTAGARPVPGRLANVARSRLRRRGSGGGSPRRARDRASASAPPPSAADGAPATSVLERRLEPAAALGQDLDEPDVEVREDEDRARAVDEDRLLAVEHPDVRADQGDVAGVGISKRSASSGCSFAMWMTALRITAGSSPAAALSPARWSRAAMVRRLTAAGRPPSRVVEVDDEADAAARHPDPDPDPVVGRVHEVHVVAAVAGLLVLEEEVRPEDRGVGAARRAAADVLGPAVARGSPPRSSRSPGLPSMKWLHRCSIASCFAYGRRDLRRDPAVEPERRDVPAARAAAAPARGDPAAGPGAVHQPEVVRLDRAPAAAADRRRPTASEPLDAVWLDVVGLRLAVVAAGFGAAAVSDGRRVAAAASGTSRTDVGRRRRRSSTTFADAGQRRARPEDEDRARSRRTRPSRRRACRSPSRGTRAFVVA